MPRLPLMTVLIACIALTVAGPPARAQVSIEEAQRRLKERTMARSSTQPSSEIDRLREENLRLRERVADLQQEVATLKEILARATPASAGVPAAGSSSPTTKPAAEDTLTQSLIGRWRGGNSASGSNYTLEFESDGTYRQTFVFNGQKETGQYRVFDDGTMEMWNDKWPDDKKHNQYRLAITPIQATLTPLIVDGNEVKKPNPLVLQRAQ